MSFHSDIDKSTLVEVIEMQPMSCLALLGKVFYLEVHFFSNRLVLTQSLQVPLILV